MVEELGVSVRRACRAVGQHRSTQRRVPTPRADEAALTDAIINLAERFGRYGYRCITALLNDDIWSVSEGRVYRIWRREGLDTRV
ncbi:MAG: transposase [Henriciella sp.]|nr:transposase [Henriciella sp.]